MKKKIQILMIFAFLLPSLAKAADGNACKLYQAYISGSQEEWLEGINAFEAKYKESGDINDLYRLVQGQYGYIGLLLGKENHDEAEKHLAKAWKNVNKLLDYRPGWAEMIALKGALYGFEIAINPAKSVFYGPKGIYYINEAFERDNESPRVWIEKANLKYYSPPIFGGNVNEAIDYYKKAIQLFETGNNTTNNWLYVNTMVSLAISYDKAGLHSKSIAVLGKILEMEPDFSWVKNELYPKVLGKKTIAADYLRK